MVVVRSGPLYEAVHAPAGFSLARISGTGPHQTDAATRAMQAVGDDDYPSVPARLANGDELFGWRSAEGPIACFCWVRYKERAIGPFSLAERRGRVFFYNAHTLPQFRGLGLYGALLEHMRTTLTREQHTEFIGDINRRNLASLRGSERAGFDAVGSVTFVTLFRRWECRLRRTAVDRSMDSLFQER